MKKLLIIPLLAGSTLIGQKPDAQLHAQLNKKLFTIIYERNSWGSSQSRSGGGSTLQKTHAVRQILPKLFIQFNIKTVLDAPCGDFNWMKTVDLSNVSTYIGLDIVEKLIESNNEKYGSEKLFFLVADLVNNPLPKVDLIICRDCIQHLPETNVFDLIKNIKRSGATYLLTSSYPQTTENTGLGNIYSAARISYRNMRIAPFNFPEPLLVIDEGFDGKTMGLWKISSLPNY